ncbi:MAG: phosphoribosyltransferase [Gemmobacter sp.]|nr:phosphoribosyltransferase [Gemmobacter sp.]
MTLAPHQFWQDLFAPGALTGDDAGGYLGHFPAALPDGRCIALPIRVLPGDGTQAVASLILNQASFAVADALADVLASRLAPFAPEVIVGVPTLGLGLADGVARRLGHRRMVALGTSRKFWYDEALSEPMRSITSPDQAKRVYLDPRMLPVLAGRRVAVVDDVASSGATLRAVLAVLARADVVPVAAGFAMAQGQGWAGALPPGMGFAAAIASPRLGLGADGRWRPQARD